MFSNVSFGKIAERWVARKLQRIGFVIVARNFRMKFGEVDIIAVDGKTLVFVEVKTRTSDRFGLPEEAVSRRKLRYIRRVSEYFATRHPELPQRMRIDVAAVEVRGGRVVEWRYFENVTVWE